MSYFDENEDRLTGAGFDQDFIDHVVFGNAVGGVLKELHYHTCADGRRMLIAEMDDQHLTNTMKLHVRVLAGSVDALAADQNPIESILYEMDADAAERYIRGFQVVFPQYVFEAAIRALPIDSILKDVRALLNRSDRLPGRGMRLLGNDEDV